MYDLPSDNPEDSGLPDTFHLDQPQLLDLTFQPPNWEQNQVFTAIDLNLYYDLNHLQWFKRPDWFAAVGVPPLYEGQDMRLSYVTWKENANPFVVVELLSPGTEDEDLGRTIQKPGKTPTKWQVYEQILRVPYYFVFSRYTDELQAFRLVGDRYERAKLTNGRLLIPELELSIGLWSGVNKTIDRLWLRWFTVEGELIPTPSEQLTENQEQLTETQEQLTETQEQLTETQEQLTETQEQLTEVQQRAEQLAARLRELGIDPDLIK